ncbi:AER071Wp [Eremothecium gossypii ATCC 10895]|uniref:AER071Wp n=1 Tax=Eremothecium gossypii (strain ATCC 10895 / CBS 109.51 / FGSC 9923 / NRRL Y-1056) TaxID=284811 RepID=Q757E2_EREGS|nr:AER071Wp [Eremothecium gossypii ATCC 10895]AAS52755.2 AER071Wp [Eremothecium gossypii ATCC 10895]AEY97061.1 FAER071Wp [Eremothecium gossypii FDAG1]
MDVTTATSTTPNIYITEAQPGHQAGGGHAAHPVQHHLGTQQHQHQMAKFRRESIAHSQGMGGVSWGSLTVGSWLKDEVMIHAHTKDGFNSNLAASNMVSFASPPSSSGSYLPNLEKQYCKDYSCCGQLLPGLHDLLRHYEEAHIATSPGYVSIAGGASLTNSMATHALQGSGMARKKVGNLSQPHQTQHSQPTQHSQQQQPTQQQPTHAWVAQHSAVQASHGASHNIQPRYGHPGSHHAELQQQQVQIPNQHHHRQALNTGAQIHAQSGMGSSQQQLHLNGNLVDAVCTNDVFLQTNNVNNAVAAAGAGAAAPSVSKIGMSSGKGLGSGMLHSKANKRNSQQPQQMNFNNYSLQMNASRNNSGTPGLQQQVQSRLMQKRSAINSAAAGVDLDFMDQDMIDEFNPDSGATLMGMQHLGTLVDGPSVLTGHISAHTSSQTQGMVKKKQPRSMNSGGNSAGTSSALGKRSSSALTASSSGRHSMSSDDDDDDDDDDQDDDLDEDEPPGKSRKQQGYIDDPARRLYVMDHEEHKPFKCPVIGCDKTYKNQNGLKYHKTHGHQNQKLHENPDGTFSIIDPESNEPYPDGMGFEKDKPYRCEVCGKRYKNLNGLKYHRGHSTH